MLIGLVKWFDADKGFGIVGTPDEGEYFLHINSFTTKPEKILKGTPIAFPLRQTKRKIKIRLTTAVDSECRIGR